MKLFYFSFFFYAVSAAGVFLIAAAVERRWFGDWKLIWCLKSLGDDAAVGTWCGEVGIWLEGLRVYSRLCLCVGLSARQARISIGLGFWTMWGGGV